MDAVTEEHFFQVTAVLGCAGCTLQVYFFFFFRGFASSILRPFPGIPGAWIGPFLFVSTDSSQNLGASLWAPEAAIRIAFLTTFPDM